jgi:hypothetical protein
MAADRDHYAEELDNLRAVLDRCVGTGQLDRAVHVAAWAGPVWFHTTQGAEGLDWLDRAAAIDASLPLDDRLAWRTAAAWCHFATAEADTGPIDEALGLAPAGHPAVPPLLCTRGWAQNFGDLVEAARVWDRLRAESAGGDPAWAAAADSFEGYGKLLHLELEAAVDRLRSGIAKDGAIHAGHPHYMLAVALHLLGRLDEAVAAADEGDRVTGASTAYFIDLARLFARVVEGVTSAELDLAHRQLRALVARTTVQYRHLPSAWGIALQGAAAAASAAGDHEVAVTLLAGARTHRLHVRYEPSLAAGRAYGRRSREALPPDRFEAARRAGQALPVPELVGLAARVAGSGGADG